MKEKNLKKKKILTSAAAVTLAMTMAVSLGACGDTEKIDWGSLVLGDVIPQPSLTDGKIITDTKSNLSVELSCNDDKVFDDYVEDCKTTGFTVDAEEDDDSYDAYNSEGYKLSVDYSDYLSELNIDLDAPLETSEISFDNSELAKLLPVPESTTGKVASDSSDYFSVYVAETPEETYKTYVDSCYSAGFDVDYSRDDDYFYADNAEGYSLEVKYEGFNIMYISISAPEDETSESAVEETTEPETEAQTEKATEAESSKTESSKAESSKAESSDSGEVTASFKETMDSYEAFMDEYIEFMEKYENSDDITGMLADYTDYMQKYADFVTKIDEIDEDSLSTADLAYYLEVTARVTKKLASVAE